jgi:TonB family protein
MYDSDYDPDGSYSYRERRFKWLAYVLAFGGGVVIGALVFGRGCPAPEEKPKAETVAVAETAAETPAAPEPEPATPETAATAEEDAIVFEEPNELPPPKITPAKPPAAEKPPRKPREVAPRPTGQGLKPPEINRVITKRLSGIQSEFNVILKNNPNLRGGKIAVRFTISSRGAVTSAEVVEDTIGNAELRAGVLRRVRSWNFPASGGESTVIYPFVFVASGA